MRICVLIDAWEPVWGGGQTHVREITRRLISGKKCEIDIFTRSLRASHTKSFIHDEEMYQGKLKIFRVGPTTYFFNLWGRLFWLAGVLLRIVKEHRKHPYDLIHGHAYLSALPAKLAGKLLSLPTVFTVHGSLNLDRKRRNLTTLFEWLILTRVKYTALISVSKSFLKYPNVNKHVFYIPNGVKVPNRYRFHKNKLSSKPKLLFVGRLEEQKGTDLLIRAIAILSKTCSVVLQIVGEGREGKKLKELTKTLHVSSQIRFLGNKPQAELYKLYRQANLLVVPSRSEGMSLTLLEAMAVGLPVVATDAGDNARLIKHGKTGFLVRSQNPSELANSILTAVNSPNLRIIGQTAQQFVRLNYNWDKVVSKTYRLYSDLI